MRIHSPRTWRKQMYSIKYHINHLEQFTNHEAAGIHLVEFFCTGWHLFRGGCWVFVWFGLRYLDLDNWGHSFFPPLTFKGGYITTPITIPTPSHCGSHRLSTSTDAVLAGIACGGCEKIRSENVNWSPKGKDHKKSRQFPNPVETYVCQFESFPQVGEKISTNWNHQLENAQGIGVDKQSWRTWLSCTHGVNHLMIVA